MYIVGLGVKKDYRSAAEWFLKSANQGNINSQFSLGVMYNTGLGVRQNRTTAKSYFGTSCDGGLQEGCDQYKKLNEQGIQ